jgi:serine phosphatase RsbU (regulator of sigma subunit)
LLKDNDIIYFFTDGFPDQFGGKENKKYTRRSFLELLEQIGNMDITEQRMSILEFFYKWKGENDQTDDITMITFKWNIDNL